MVGLELGFVRVVLCLSACLPPSPEVKKKLATFVEGNSKAPFSIATAPRCWEGRYSTLPLTLLHFTLDAYLIMLSVKQGSINYHFLSLWYEIDVGLNPGLPDHWRTLYSLGQRRTIILSKTKSQQ